MYKKLLILISLCGIMPSCMAMQQELRNRRQSETTIWQQYTQLLDRNNPSHPLSSPDGFKKAIHYLTRLRNSDNKQLALRAVVELATLACGADDNRYSTELKNSIWDALEPIATIDPATLNTQNYLPIHAIAKAKHLIALKAQLELKDPRVLQGTGALALYKEAAMFIQTHLPQTVYGKTIYLPQNPLHKEDIEIALIYKTIIHLCSLVE